MAFKFKCEHCGNEIMSNHLQIGEYYKCKKCIKKTKVPEGVKQTEAISLKKMTEKVPDLIPFFSVMTSFTHYTTRMKFSF